MASVPSELSLIKRSTSCSPIPVPLSPFLRHPPGAALMLLLLQRTECYKCRGTDGTYSLLGERRRVRGNKTRTVGSHRGRLNQLAPDPAGVLGARADAAALVVAPQVAALVVPLEAVQSRAPVHSRRRQARARARALALTRVAWHQRRLPAQQTQ